MTELVAVYARSASGDASEIEEQIRACGAAGAALGGRGPIYTDNAEGGRLAYCPARLAMIKGAQGGKFRHLYMRDLACLSHDQAILALLLGVLAAAGIAVHTLDGPSELGAVIGCDAAAQLTGLLGRGQSFDEQVALCRGMALRLGYELVAIDADQPSPSC